MIVAKKGEEEDGQLGADWLEGIAADYDQSRRMPPFYISSS